MQNRRPTEKIPGAAARGVQSTLKLIENTGGRTAAVQSGYQ